MRRAGGLPSREHHASHHSWRIGGPTRSVRVRHILAALPALGAGLICGGGEKSLTHQPISLTFAAVSAGGFYSCGVTSDGVAYCWGRNDFEIGRASCRERV